MILPENQSKILLSPYDTTLIVVDHQLAFASCFESSAVAESEEGVAMLVGAAVALDVPVIASLVETNRITSELSCRLDAPVTKAIRFSRTGANPWDDPSFSKAVKTANRPRLLIAGLSVETSVSFTALCALEQGFDVYVVKDACLGHSDESFATTFDRLTQAGVVPVSWRQIILEWRKTDADIALLRRILKARRLSGRRNLPSQDDA